MCSWNPMIFEDYWRQHLDLGTTVIPTYTEWTTDYGSTNLMTIPHLLLQWPFKNFMHWQRMLWQRYVTSCSKLAHTSSSMLLYLTLLSNIIMFQTLYPLFFTTRWTFSALSKYMHKLCKSIWYIYIYLSSSVPELWMLFVQWRCAQQMVPFCLCFVFSCTLLSSTLQYIQKDNGMVPLPCAFKTVDRNV
jgi:hypothetical protein